MQFIDGLRTTLILCLFGLCLVQILLYVLNTFLYFIYNLLYMIILLHMNFAFSYVFNMYF